MKCVYGKDILLFYKKHKWDYVNRYSQRTISGFYAWYLQLVESLNRRGYRVYENDYRLAKENPRYPIGLVGTPIAVPRWSLSNPAILGPSMYDHPKMNPTLIKDNRFKYYLLTCKWLKDIFEPYYGNSCVLWYAGIDTDVWIDTKNHKKDIDVLIYDKIRWNRDQLIPSVLIPVIKIIKKKSLTFKILRYGNITHTIYKRLLSRSRSMLFLCEHETQGMAYQEALASNVPVLAWDPGYWVDPIWIIYESRPAPATSVPYFSNKCGETFKTIKNFERVFAKFWKSLSSYKPRQFVKRELSLDGSADIYAKYYFSI